MAEMKRKSLKRVIMADIITKIHFHFPIRKSTIQKKLQRKKKTKKKGQIETICQRQRKDPKNYQKLFQSQRYKVLLFLLNWFINSIPSTEDKEYKKNTGYKILNRTGKIHKDLYNTIYNSTCQVIGNKS